MAVAHQQWMARADNQVEGEKAKRLGPHWRCIRHLPFDADKKLDVTSNKKRPQRLNIAHHNFVGEARHGSNSARQCGRQQGPCWQWSHAETHAPFLAPCSLMQLALEIIGIGKQDTGPFNHKATLRSKAYPRAIPIKQPHPGLLFQRLNAARERGLGQAQILSGA